MSNPGSEDSPKTAQLAQECYTIRQSESAFSKKTPLNLQKNQLKNGKTEI
jgi:hypothetical protein